MKYYLIKEGGEIITLLNKVHKSFYVEGTKIMKYLENNKLELGKECCIVNDKGLAAERGESWK